MQRHLLDRLHWPGPRTGAAPTGTNVMLNGFGDLAAIDTRLPRPRCRERRAGRLQRRRPEQAPGYMRARLVEGQIRPSAHDMPEERVIREVILAYQPNKAFRRTGALGAFVLFLCSDAAGSITGAAPPIEGG